MESDIVRKFANCRRQEALLTLEAIIVLTTHDKLIAFWIAALAEMTDAEL